MQLSPRRKVLRVLGVAFAILGGITIYYAAFVMQSPSLYFEPEPGLYYPEGNTLRQYRIIVGLVGIGLLYLGHVAYPFIPTLERED